MNRKRIFLSPPHLCGKEIEYINEAIETNWIAPLGPNVNAFEKEIAEYIGSKGALALSSGTAAIHLALRLLGVSEKDTVFCSTLTFAASANPILYQGAEPVFIDSEPESWNMSPIALQKAFDAAIKNGKIPRAVIVVNLYGQSANMDPIIEICDDYGVPIIEDAAESLGATYKGKASGTLGKFGIYSFNGNKIITTSGGGMLVSDDLELLEKARFYATQARDSEIFYQHSELGYNYRMSNILAGVGRAQLKVLDDYIIARRTVFEIYENAFLNFKGINFMPEASYGMSNRWLTALTIDPEICGLTSFEIIDELARNNIESRPIWKPMHLQPLFSKYKYYTHYPEESFSNSLFNNGICLPSGSNLKIEEQTIIIEIIKNLLQKKQIYVKQVL